MNVFDDCKVLDGRPQYLIVEDIPPTFEESRIRALIDWGIQQIHKSEVHSFSIVFAKNQLNQTIESYLNQNKLRKIATNIFYEKDLRAFQEPNEYLFELQDIEHINPEVFIDVWQKAQSGSLNTGDSASADQIFLGLQKELGSHYRTYCNVAYKGSEPVGVVIAHPEPGTTSEGRLFYFGLLPKWRKRGLGGILHREALAHLKRMGMQTYVGATGEKNIPMQKIFLKNGCTVMDKRVTYRIQSDD